MRFVKFDLDTYIRTKDMSGGAIYTVVEDDLPELEMITDEQGHPTRGGLIGYALAYALMAGFVGAMFYIL
ncbi:hypothetical protein EBBID32_15570 [Sphingobium indicum BiD32]|uniref:Uncharacterized protein n=1 Tax=Sphingobium indicum BiD32 TaxID=1301087 RepID=N1MP63_9SPHN|nr:hypothetical protein [Sphingobium indicum]CCW17218.1 hypothetical protein EBBID32_15570 [Sphingobium indicum BiD32]